jgi:hypothetical protein
VDPVPVDVPAGADVADHRVVLPGVPQVADDLDDVPGLAAEVGDRRAPVGGGRGVAGGHRGQPAGAAGRREVEGGELRRDVERLGVGGRHLGHEPDRGGRPGDERRAGDRIETGRRGGTGDGRQHGVGEGGEGQAGVLGVPDGAGQAGAGHEVGGCEAGERGGGRVRAGAVDVEAGEERGDGHGDLRGVGERRGSGGAALAAGAPRRQSAVCAPIRW